MTIRFFATLCALAALCGCSRDTPEAGDAGEAATVPRPAIDAQELKAPCEWLTTAEVVDVYGDLTGAPRRVHDVDNWGADESGDACAYPVTTEFGPANLVLQLDPTGAPEFESAAAMMSGVIAQELPPSLQGDATEAPTPPEGWDYVGWVAGVRVYRVGHVAILMNVTNSRANDEQLDRMARLFRGKIPDKPFMATRNDAGLLESASDPCELITKAEAEAVLGPLATPPYRSLKGAPLAHVEGPSCTYYTSGHRTFTVKPDYYDGKEHFDMVAGLGSLVRSNLGGADEGDLLDGPWDAATAGSSGELMFVQGDTMLEIRYGYSAANIEGAAKLAAIAMARAMKISAGEGG